MPFFTPKLRSHSRNSSVSSVSSCPAERGATPQARSALGSPEAGTSFVASIQEEEKRWPTVSAEEKQHLIGQRLTKTLRYLASDKCVLGYLTAFLESRHVAGYLHFWMEAEVIRRRLEAADSPASDCDGPHLSSSNPARRSTPNPPRVSSADSSRVTSPDSMSVREPPRTDASATRCDPVVVTTGVKADSPASPSDRLLWGGTVSDTATQNGEHLAPASALSRLLRKYCGADGGPAALSLPPAISSKSVESVQEAVSVLVAAQAEAEALIADAHLAEFLQSDHYQCYQVNVLTSGSVEICDILFNEAVVFTFMEFMEQEGLSHYVEFWMSSNNFRDQLYAMGDDCDALQTQNDAMVLYRKYFSLQAACTLGFGDETRTELELNICREGGPDPECFLRPMLVLHNVLQQRYLSGFRNSQVFFKHVMHLVNTLQHPAKPYTIDRTEDDTFQKIHELRNSASSFSPHALSTCSSELGSSVTGGSVPERWSHPDPGQLHRRRYYGLSIGHVNHVGRYESHLEPHPDVAKPSVLRRAFRSLLRNEQSKVQEEMAWRVANLIVKDVTNVTLGPGGSPTHHGHC